MKMRYVRGRKTAYKKAKRFASLYGKITNQETFITKVWKHNRNSYVVVANNKHIIAYVF